MLDFLGLQAICKRAAISTIRPLFFLIYAVNLRPLFFIRRGCDFADIAPPIFNIRELYASKNSRRNKRFLYHLAIFFATRDFLPGFASLIGAKNRRRKMPPALMARAIGIPLIPRPAKYRRLSDGR